MFVSSTNLTIVSLHSSLGLRDCHRRKYPFSPTNDTDSLSLFGTRYLPSASCGEECGDAVFCDLAGGASTSQLLTDRLLGRYLFFVGTMVVLGQRETVSNGTNRSTALFSCYTRGLGDNTTYVTSVDVDVRFLCTQRIKATDSWRMPTCSLTLKTVSKPVAPPTNFTHLLNLTTTNVDAAHASSGSLALALTLAVVSLLLGL